MKPSNLLIWVIVFAIISSSPLFKMIGVSYSLLILAEIGIFLFLTIQKKYIKIDKNESILILIILILSSVTAIYYYDVRIQFLPVFFIAQLLIASSLNRHYINKLTNILTKICLIFLALAWLSLLYTIAGGKPLLTLSIQGYHDFHLFLTSFTNTSIELWSLTGFIRPSVIFDEPGAFSFFICFVVIMRVMLGKHQITTLIILLLGFVTFSLAHLVFVIIYVIMIYGKFDIRMASTVFFSSLLLLILLNYTELGNAFSRLLLNRLEFTNGGAIAGDNRTGQLLGNYSLLNLKNFFMGLDANCIMSVPNCRNIYSMFGAENVLSPLVQRGILLSFPYYGLLLYFFLIGFKKRSLLLFVALALLFFQRPYILNYAYGYYAIIPYLYYKRYLK